MPKRADTWGVDTAKVTINDQEKTATLVNGVAVIDVSDCIEMGEDYTYGVTLIGNYRGKDLSVNGGTKEVFIGNQDTWFTYVDGAFSNADADANLTNEGGFLSAAQVEPRGCVNPREAAPGEPVAIEFVSTMVVAGVVQESALETLDAASAKAALTVVGFGTDAVVEGDRVQATGEAIQLKAKKPADVENACFFRVLVNAADKK